MTCTCVVQDEAEQRRCVELAASELRQILGGKRLARGDTYVPGPKPGISGPPQVGSLQMVHCQVHAVLYWHCLPGCMRVS